MDLLLMAEGDVGALGLDRPLGTCYTMTVFYTVLVNKTCATITFYVNLRCQNWGIKNN